MSFEANLIRSGGRLRRKVTSETCHLDLAQIKRQVIPSQQG
jgi:hypothetical protein